MINTDGNFYLGRIFDPQANELTDQPLLYDPADLTTHAVIVGMTGSGKTGLCLDMMEEAALNQIPALMVDPKGDITNALLHFPELAPADFAPWVNPDEARRAGKTVDEAAAATAALWRNGLADWDITPERIQQLKERVQFAIYTPGSDAGLPVSILASLKAPDISWENNQELLREKIGGTVTAVLGLVGFKNIDPIRSREHILLSNIFEHAWSQGLDLDLGELIMQVQAPPFEKLGVFPIDRFFPEDDRFDLSLQLNNILAAPAFQSWIEGEPLDVGRLLYTADGQPRHTIFYIAHLNDDERMFFVTLLYSAVESWMRAQKGSTALRALVYFDEIFGYLPPVGNPPSKEPMLRLLKQARAFGVGLVLATQNPVDIDYKALSNAGTWFIGKLGTDQDKQRLLDGLSSALGGGLDRREYDDLISALGKRVFLLRNVHDKRPSLFQTRWAMNYLAGPVTRTQIPQLNELVGAVVDEPVEIENGELKIENEAVAVANEQLAMNNEQALELPISNNQHPLTNNYLPAKPAVPSSVGEYILPQNLTLHEALGVAEQYIPADAEPVGLLYRPVLLAQADVGFVNRKFKLNLVRSTAVLVPEPDRRGALRWGDFPTEPVNSRQLDRVPLPDAHFSALDEALNDRNTLTALKKDFQDWIYHDMQVMVQANEPLKVYAGPDVGEDEFRRQCLTAAQPKMEAEEDKIAAQFERKIDRIEQKLVRERRELADDENEYARRKREETVNHAELLVSLFSRRRKSLSSSMTKRRMTEKAKEDVEESEAEIARLTEEMVTMEADLQEALADVEAKWQNVAANVTEIPVSPYKKDIDVAFFGVAWLPHHLVLVDGKVEELPAYGRDG